MEQVELEPVPTWDAGATGCSFTQYTTVPAPHLFYRHNLNGAHSLMGLWVFAILPLRIIWLRASRWKGWTSWPDVNSQEPLHLLPDTVNGLEIIVYHGENSKPLRSPNTVPLTAGTWMLQSFLTGVIKSGKWFSSFAKFHWNFSIHHLVLTFFHVVFSYSHVAFAKCLFESFLYLK